MKFFLKTRSMSKLLLQIPSKSQPYAVLAVTSFLKLHQHKIEIIYKTQDAVSLISEGKTIHGEINVCRFLARHSGLLYGSDAYTSTRIDQWLEYVQLKICPVLQDYKSLQPAVQEMNHYLKLRSFFSGYELSLADLVIWGTLKQSPLFLKMTKNNVEWVDVLRWFQFINQLPQTKDAIALLQKPIEKKMDQGSFDIDLPNAEMYKVVTRFPPEPSGYLHIGHAKAALLNQYFAQLYKGKLIIRFDDTNPSKEKLEYEHSIMEDLELLQIKGDRQTWTSDYFNEIYELALKLIRDGKAYVDDTKQEEMRAERMDGRASRNRDLSVEENLKRFEEMRLGTEFGLQCCLRAKISVSSKNKALRDPVIYRTNLTPHQRTSTNWKIYPTYDFACPIVDSLEGVTHALRTNEYHDRNDQYVWFLNNLGLRRVYIWDYSRINFCYTLLSKRKLSWFVDQSLVEGWNDPRFPTVRGILRRGLRVDALKKYMLMQGASKNTILLEWDKLWALNKSLLDPISPRYTALLKHDLVRVKVDGQQGVEVRQVLKYKKNEGLGMKNVVYGSEVWMEQFDCRTLEEGEEVTLMDWGNIIIQSITKQDGIVTHIDVKLHLEGDYKKTKKKLSWISNTPDSNDLIQLELVDYDYLIIKKKLEDGDVLEDFINPQTVFMTEAVGDQNLRELRKGDVVQFERRGFYICDGVGEGVGGEGSSGGSEVIKMIQIPDGKAASVALKYQGSGGGK